MKTHNPRLVQRMLGHASLERALFELPPRTDATTTDTVGVVTS